MADRDVNQSGRTFTARLQELMRTVHPPGRDRYTQMEIVEAIRKHGGDISQQYLSELLRGARTVPSARIIGHLADFFGVTPEYFVDDDEYARTNELIELMRKAAESDRQMVKRALMLPPDSIAKINELVEEERRRVGLSD